MAGNIYAEASWGTLQIHPRRAFLYFFHSFRHAFVHQITAAFAAFRAEVYHPVCRFNHVGIVLDDQNAVAFVNQRVEGLQELFDVVEMQAGGRLVEDEEKPLLSSEK